MHVRNFSIRINRKKNSCSKKKYIFLADTKKGKVLPPSEVLRQHFYGSCGETVRSLQLLLSFSVSRRLAMQKPSNAEYPDTHDQCNLHAAQMQKA